MTIDENEEDMISFREEILEHRKKMINYKSEIATMYENGTIVVLYKGALSDGQPTLATRDIKSADSDYIDICKSFKLNKPGDSYFKTYKLVDGEWILESEGKDEN